MKRLLAYLFIVLGLGLTFSVNAEAEQFDGIICGKYDGSLNSKDKYIYTNLWDVEIYLDIGKKCKKIRKYSRGATYTIYKMIDEGSIKPKVNYSHVADYIRNGLPKICLNTNINKIRQSNDYIKSRYQKKWKNCKNNEKELVIDHIATMSKLSKTTKESQRNKVILKFAEETQIAKAEQNQSYEVGIKCFNPANNKIETWSGYDTCPGNRTFVESLKEKQKIAKDKKRKTEEKIKLAQKKKLNKKKRK